MNSQDPDRTTVGIFAIFLFIDTLTFNEYENCKYYGSEANPYMILVGVIDANATSFTIHEETKIIYSDAMRNCTSVTDIALPEGLLSIGFWSMAGMKSVKTFNIPSSVIDIDEYAFANAASLETFTVSEGNKVFASINNSPVNVKTKTLVAGCKNSVIPMMAVLRFWMTVLLMAVSD